MPVFEIVAKTKPRIFDDISFCYIIFFQYIVVLKDFKNLNLCAFSVWAPSTLILTPSLGRQLAMQLRY